MKYHMAMIESGTGESEEHVVDMPDLFTLIDALNVLRFKANDCPSEEDEPFLEMNNIKHMGLKDSTLYVISIEHYFGEVEWLASFKKMESGDE